MSRIRPSTRRGSRPGWGSAALLLLAALGLSAAAGCATAPEPRKRTFMGLADSMRREPAQPRGLNPLGSLNTCGTTEQPPDVPRQVLISRPEWFTESASLMIVALREALAERRDIAEPPGLLLSSKPILTVEDAREEGLRCDALMVLWERHGSSTLEMTLPNPARVPLRGLVQQQLCEFGNHGEQAAILYYTILGLTAVERLEFEQARYYLATANQIDVECLHLPLTDGSPPEAATAN